MKFEVLGVKRNFPRQYEPDADTDAGRMYIALKDMKFGNVLELGVHRGDVESVRQLAYHAAKRGGWDVRTTFTDGENGSGVLWVQKRRKA